MNYEGVVYRPPSEARSLILQVTIGCAHNTCTFCNMYKAKTFRIRTMDEILAEIKELVEMGYAPYIRKVFLADGDALVLPARMLLDILAALKKAFPLCKRVSAYGTARDVLNKTDAELTALREAGLELIYIGAETGDDEILRYIRKSVTAEEIGAAGEKLKKNGMGTSVTFISGLGGRQRVERHAVSCAELLNRMNPEFASFLTLRLYEGTPMYDEVAGGRFERITPDEIMDEMEIFLGKADSPGTVFRTNHASNYVILAGTMNEDIPAMLGDVRKARKYHAYRRFRETGDLL